MREKQPRANSVRIKQSERASTAPTGEDKTLSRENSQKKVGSRFACDYLKSAIYDGSKIGIELDDEEASKQLCKVQ